MLTDTQKSRILQQQFGENPTPYRKATHTQKNTNKQKPAIGHGAVRGAGWRGCPHHLDRNWRDRRQTPTAQKSKNQYGDADRAPIEIRKKERKNIRQSTPPYSTKVVIVGHRFRHQSCLYGSPGHKPTSCQEGINSKGPRRDP